jgi:hypothetical protein
MASCWNLLYKYSKFRKIIPQKSDNFGAVFSQKPFVYESHWIYFWTKKVDVHNFHNLLNSFVWFL